MPDDLAISSLPGHSAIYLCNDGMSQGPDFAFPTEGMFCDMSSIDNRKQLWPLCSDSITEYRIDMETYGLKGPNGISDPDLSLLGVNITLPSNVSIPSNVQSTPNVPNKSYKNINTWS